VEVSTENKTPGATSCEGFETSHIFVFKLVNNTAVNMPLWKRNAVTALEWTLLFPLIPAIVYKRRIAYALCVVHTTVTVWAIAIAADPSTWHPGVLALPAIMVVCWALHCVGLSTVATLDEPRLTIVRLLGFASAINFATTATLRTPTSEHQFVLRICRAIVHGAAIVTVLLLGLFYGVMLPTHEAWGCYPPTETVTDEKYGMCGTNKNKLGPGWWVSRSTKESEVCKRFEAYGNYVCIPPVSATQAFGTYVAVGHNAALLSLAAYCYGCLFAWEVGVDLLDDKNK
jgi:hypothetical protein